MVQGSLAKTCATWAKALQSTVERSVCAGPVLALWVPRTSSTSCDQPVFVDHATYASVPSDTVLLKIDRFG